LPETRPSQTPQLPGAIGISHLRVYDTVSPDGLAGGTPHLHTLCTEAYAVVSGTGRVQTLTASGEEETRLEPGALVWFTPGTIHRLVNDGDLEILVLMQNAGLPEAGDLVITFAPDVMADAEAYRAAATLPADETTTAGSGDAARARRDAAVLAFGDLRAATARGDDAPLRAFHDAAVQLVQPRLEEFELVWNLGPERATASTRSQLEAMAAGDAGHLGDASVHSLPPPGTERRMGCCGTLGTYVR
jgi:mannose-6-phosphate isomerase-like protein (cupin superfamily)